MSTRSVVRGDEEDATAVVQVVDPTSTGGGDDEAERTRDGLAENAEVDQVRDPRTIMNPVLVDADGNVTSDRTANFVADAGWERNPAAEWTNRPGAHGSDSEQGR